MIHPVPHEPPAVESDNPDVPGFRSWRGVYLFVIACFVVSVVLLAVFTRTYS